MLSPIVFFVFLYITKSSAFVEPEANTQHKWTNCNNIFNEITNEVPWYKVENTTYN